MKAPAARELERRLDDLATGLRDFGEDIFESVGVQHHEGTTGNHLGALLEPARDAAVLEAGVIGSVVLELPAERRLIELFGAGDVCRAEFDVVDLPVVLSSHVCLQFKSLRSSRTR